jgi:hypothetical protein
VTNSTIPQTTCESRPFIRSGLPLLILFFSAYSPALSFGQHFSSESPTESVNVAPQPLPLENKVGFTFQKRLQWYAKITYTDRSRLVWLVGEVTADDFLFDGVGKWGSGLSGWGKSLAAVYGQRVIANTTELFVGQLIGDDARYRPSGKKGVTRRVWYATNHAFTAQARSGNTRPAYSRCIAVTTGALVANQWLPHPKTGADLTRTLIFGVTDKIQDDLLAEFSPDLKRFGRKIWRRIQPRPLSLTADAVQ